MAWSTSIRFFETRSTPRSFFPPTTAATICIRMTLVVRPREMRFLSRCSPASRQRLLTFPPVHPYNVSVLVLASASPRRQELLRDAGIAFEVHPAHITEDPLPDETAKDCAERLAREKALTVARARPKEVVLGADTVVVVAGQI